VDLFLDNGLQQFVAQFVCIFTTALVILSLYFVLKLFSFLSQGFFFCLKALAALCAK